MQRHGTLAARRCGTCCTSRPGRHAVVRRSAQTLGLAVTPLAPLAYLNVTQLTSKVVQCALVSTRYVCALSKRHLVAVERSTAMPHRSSARAVARASANVSQSIGAVPAPAVEVSGQLGLLVRPGSISGAGEGSPSSTAKRPPPSRWPNPSLERTSTGKALGPRAGQYHHPSRGPSASPVASAQLKR